MALLVLGAIAMPLAFSTWSALINNFVIEVGGYGLGQWVLFGCALISLAAMEVLALRVGGRRRSR